MNEESNGEIINPQGLTHHSLVAHLELLGRLQYLAEMILRGWRPMQLYLALFPDYSLRETREKPGHGVV